MGERCLKVVCLHGHPGNGEAMQMFVEHFQGLGIEAIAPDLRGYGRNQVSAAFQMSDHINDLWNLLIDISQDCQTDYLLLGWSLGGIMAMELALMAIADRRLEGDRGEKIVLPNIVGLVLIATAAKPRSNLPKISIWEYANLLIAVGLHRLLPKFLAKQGWHINWFGRHSLIKYLIQQHIATAYDRISTTGAKAYLQTSRYAQQALLQALRQGYDRTIDLSKIKIPCLMLAAEGDRHITTAASVETANLLADCEFISYLDTAHLLPWEIGDRLLTDIDRWCVQRLHIRTNQ
ncbi:MAG: alpha/beta hydrolase [Oscillatoriales cyanobacterium CG2_30_44_21]|nr:MAG: alpha/beta hydrolase [Oscillatoriales cyanobacterium CG2_30_44_21]